ncbi:MAG TPA: tetratricopeptide repeat protein, partial [Verrucomicrobiae bacterium]|nr:tetratricopeptide repeat protein [Verrucomicrobiae bacterium]
MMAGDAAPIFPVENTPGGETGLRAAFKSAAICLFLALAVWVVFGQTVHFHFINYDDDAIVYENPVVTRGLDVHEIARVFTRNSGRDSWYPLTDMTHMLDWQLYGPKAGGHHLTNVLLHAATAIVLFLALHAMTSALWRSAFVAAIFAIHPLRAESVAWIAERKDVLSGLFFMLALWAWFRHIRRAPSPLMPGSQVGNALAAVNPARWTAGYYWALAFFVFGMLSKATIVTFPIILLVLDIWPLGRLSSSVLSKLVSEKWPFFLLSMAGCAVTLHTQTHVVLAANQLTYPWRFANALMAYTDYLGHVICPMGLALLYPHPPIHLSLAKLFVSVAVFLGISVGAFSARKKHPYLAAGWLWYLVAFFPVIDIMQIGDQTRADRYTYLPQIGLLIMIAWGTPALFRRLPFQRIILTCAGGSVLVALSADAYIQTTYWKNSVSIWTRTLSLWPQSYIADCNLAIALADQGDVAGAVVHFNRALRINPLDAKSINNLGKILISQGNLDAAIQDFQRALKLEPDNVRVLNNLGVALAAEGKVNEAVQDLEKSLRLIPEDADTYYDLGNIYASRAEYADASLYYQQALHINPDFAEAHCNLGLALARLGKLGDAIHEYEQAIRFKPRYLDALNDLGGALTARGDMDAAAGCYRRVLELKPADPNTLNNLGVILARQGQLDSAVKEFNQAIQLNPSDPSSYNNLAIALASQGKMSEAIEHLQQALVLARARNNPELEQSIRDRIKIYQSSPSPGQEH